MRQAGRLIAGRSSIRHSSRAVTHGSGESVRGAKESDEDDKPLLPPPAPAAERKSLLGSLFGGKK